MYTRSVPTTAQLAAVVRPFGCASSTSAGRRLLQAAVELHVHTFDARERIVGRACPAVERLESGAGRRRLQGGAGVVEPRAFGDDALEREAVVAFFLAHDGRAVDESVRGHEIADVHLLGLLQ